ncbi:hypothetical protein I546_1376 [Mycobacterium kansasii 732]|uniref:Uncharacterized protein n=1 Tax=Mycobacterium pseudokansasii TaxID=2341080 RepID=A0A498QJ87_9MYCO|nr:hypothetical protein [Mycobacterium pseudokansasii]EUA15528.1 hypothetical protein I546_1376 [Mycobacterium kansasii 732]KZS67764.1 hypothetical protein A4G27_15090 [Mycobacterium kansasii]MBY0388081.1 hypothetical protein [Mycobacterium pseudokansasii]VAZ87994.1 hypothetical protein LAUMK35_00401 [Mycobacterium pseudokansasii]VAZ88375.1 hypothetical protein LAUMK21_00401 [Mycobacterium pseudokansasii]
MITPTFGISDYLATDAHRGPRTDTKCLRYRLEVVATSAVDVVHAAGGWLYDRATAGWEVTVVLPSGGGTRPLQILGARTADLETGLTESRPGGQSLAVSAGAFAADDRVRERVLEALEHRSGEVALWGDEWPWGLNSAISPVRHVLSSAAQAFKRQALKAAGIPCGSVESVETLFCDTRWWG